MLRPRRWPSHVSTRRSKGGMSGLLAQMLGPPVAAAAMLLLAGGWSKLRTPGHLSSVMRQLGVPLRPSMVRILGAGEVTIGIFCMAAPSRSSLAAMAVMFGCFAAFATYVRLDPRGSGVSSCGCLGSDDVAPSWAHVTIDAVAALTAMASSAIGPSGLLHTARRMGLPGVVLVAGTTGLAYVCYLTFSYFPRAWNAYRGSIAARGRAAVNLERAGGVPSHG